MLLHEFLSTHREEILAACQLELTDGAAGDHLVHFAAVFIDDVQRALRRDSGFPQSTSPLPQSSASAASFGANLHEAGGVVTDVPVIFAALSQALGRTGVRHHLTISAEDYKMLNACLDTGIAASIEKFAQLDKARETAVLTREFGHLAHELRNTLGNATLAWSLLRAEDLTVNGRTGDVLAKNLSRMNALIAQWLASVRLEAGVTPTLVPVRVAAVLRDLELAAIPERGISIVVEAEEAVFIEADEMLLNSAVGNLVHNALKFSRSGSTVVLRARTSAEAVQIEVEDQCGGLGHSDPTTLFDPFVKQSKNNATGVGLGLTIAKRAVEAMNGSLGVVDLPGHGCRFSARFPR